jgi:rSAM/selenodomain-associated transferase 2
VNFTRNGRLTISVIVPSWHDADYLAVLLPTLARIELVAETIVVDASGDEQSEQEAARCGARFLPCPSPSRGEQMNLGAAAARGDVFIFQHADAELTRPHVAAIVAALNDATVLGGAFFRKFDERHPRLLWLEGVARFFTRHGGTLYGDQSVFVRREWFERLGGFAEIPLMEDVEFSRRLRAAGPVAVLDPPIRSSSRRHLEEGAWGKSLQNGLFLFLYRLGVSPARLHSWYYRNGKRYSA